MAEVVTQSNGHGIPHCGCRDRRHPSQMATVIRQDIERWKPVVERGGIKVD